MSDVKQSTPLREIVKWVNIGCACAIIAITILGCFAKFLQFWNWIFFTYQFIFAGMIIAAEFRLDFILKYFRFLEGNIGKGWFLIFCGMWMIGYTIESDITGYCLVGCGVISIFILTFTK